MRVAKAKGRLRGKQPKLKSAQEAHLVELWRAGKHQRRARRTVLRRPFDRLPCRAARWRADQHGEVGARLSAQAFADESGRASGYHVCVVVVANGDVDGLRRLVRSFCLPGQRRWHFVHERDSRRRQVIDALLATGQVTALIYYGKGRDAEIRAESFRRMVQPLLRRGVTRLIIESRDGRDDLDRQVLIAQLRRHREEAFGYDHMPPHGDPLLWIADALAWCSSAGGRWRERIDSIIISQEVKRP